MKLNLKNVGLVLGLATVSFFNSSYAAVGGDSGGGGGVYKVAEGKYMTLPEAGILIRTNSDAAKSFPKLYVISEKTKKEVEKIVTVIETVMPGIQVSAEKIYGDRSAFIQLNDVDQAQYQKIKAEYKKVFKGYGYSLDDEKFILPAYSTLELKNDVMVGKTYILPDFDLLTPAQQAKILIHELNMRTDIGNVTRETKLRNALAVDVHINNILNGKKLLSLGFKDLVQNFSTFKLIDNSDDKLRITLMGLQQELNRPLQIEELFLKAKGKDFDNTFWTYTEEINPSLVQGLQEQNGIKENYAELLEGISVYAGKASYITDEEEKEFNGVCAKLGKTGKHYAIYAGRRVFRLVCRDDYFLYGSYFYTQTE